jgi:hypothetical protein
MAADGGSISMTLLVDGKECHVRAMNRTDGNKDIVVNGIANNPDSMKQVASLLGNYGLGPELAGNGTDVSELVKIVSERIDAHSREIK